MSMIVASATGALSRARKTVTFAGTAGTGAVGTVALFTITGRVLIHRMLMFCTTTLVSAGGGSIAIGTTAFDASIVGPATTASAFATNDWISGTVSLAGEIGFVVSGTNNQYVASWNKALSQDIKATITVADVTAGVIVMDVWYEPVTDNGVLVAA